MKYCLSSYCSYANAPLGSNTLDWVGKSVAEFFTMVDCTE